MHLNWFCASGNANNEISLFFYNLTVLFTGLQYLQNQINITYSNANFDPKPISLRNITSLILSNGEVSISLPPSLQYYDFCYWSIQDIILDESNTIMLPNFESDLKLNHNRTYYIFPPVDLLTHFSLNKHSTATFYDYSGRMSHHCTSVTKSCSILSKRPYLVKMDLREGRNPIVISVRKTRSKGICSFCFKSCKFDAFNTPISHKNELIYKKCISFDVTILVEVLIGIIIYSTIGCWYLKNRQEQCDIVSNKDEVKPLLLSKKTPKEAEV
ncbi:hypothetical protein TRFO_12723 [Tritrichomonas foetus]|uniref:Uncharacterized protein n=1 Tax=Tritrichomonas foetus TaxID=1144522 RepID=A0A1J4L0S8_9EUKA|nr:hypothetical protein TRFO_12723 [Tritrichomonas foetus]|eukprot:OHT17026.1 hypothetical protein TRFO_12723 [Tritrichomonas foetus]